MVRTEVKETAQIPVNTMALRNGIEFSLLFPPTLNFEENSFKIQNIGVTKMSCPKKNK